MSWLLNCGHPSMPRGLGANDVPGGKCKQCSGRGGYMTLPHLVYGRRWHRCRACDGTGEEAAEPDECLDCGEVKCICGEDEIDELE